MAAITSLALSLSQTNSILSSITSSAFPALPIKGLAPSVGLYLPTPSDEKLQ
jgi:hypothetical protein